MAGDHGAPVLMSSLRYTGGGKAGRISTETGGGVELIWQTWWECCTCAPPTTPLWKANKTRREALNPLWCWRRRGAPVSMVWAGLPGLIRLLGRR